MRTSLILFALFATAFFSLSGCNAPRETIPVFNSSSGTTDAVEPDAPDPDPAIPATSGTTDPAGASESSQASQTEVRLIDYDGLQQTVAELAGKVVVVDIWSTSCLPCMREFHHLVELSERYPERLRCISLNVDYIGLPKETPDSHLANVLAFLEKQRASSVTNFVASEPDSDILEKFDVESMPAILLFDTDGKLVAKVTDATAGEGGLSYKADVIPQVETLLAADDR